jgi:DNA-binding LytR/AlgR family response regulator
VTDIRYIENIGNYIYIHTGKEKVAAYLTLAEVLAKLPEADFSRIHQSFIVNHRCIISMEYSQVRLTEELSLPVGGTYRQAFRTKFRDTMLISKREPQANKD